MDALGLPRSGMELFEEALRRWEEAVNFRNRLADDEAECSSVKMGAGDAIAEETVEVCNLYRCTLKLLRFFRGKKKNVVHSNRTLSVASSSVSWRLCCRGRIGSRRSSKERRDSQSRPRTTAVSR